MAILIVEDHVAMRSALRELLHREFPELTILEAGTGAHALALCDRFRPQLILMDIKLPDANGIELTAQIKNRLPETAVIVVSKHSDQMYADRALAAKAFGFVRKDTIGIQLLPMIAQALHGSARA